jgi:hypothetical protein
MDAVIDENLIRDEAALEVIHGASSAAAPAVPWRIGISRANTRGRCIARPLRPARECDAPVAD